jgi:formiminotetrahydrofolate cyclodeaminase
MEHMAIDEWLASLAKAQATPGGNAAAALAAATAAALVCRVSSYTTGQKWHDREKEIKAALDEATGLQKRATELMATDESTINNVLTAFNMPVDTPEHAATRSVAVKAALDQAAKLPQQIAIVNHRTVKLCSDLALMGNPLVIAQVAIAANFARASLESTIIDMRSHEQFVTEPVVKNALTAVITAAQSDVQVAHAVMNQVRERIENP